MFFCPPRGVFSTPRTLGVRGQIDPQEGFSNHPLGFLSPKGGFSDPERGFSDPSFVSVFFFFHETTEKDTTLLRTCTQCG